MKKLDPNTWCESDIKAGVNLVDILSQSNDRHLIKKISRIIHDYDCKLKDLSNLKNYKEFYLRFTLHNTIEHIKSCYFDVVVETHLLNLIRAKYRKNLKSI